MIFHTSLQYFRHLFKSEFAPLGNLWSLCREDLWETWLNYNGTALYYLQGLNTAENCIQCDDYLYYASLMNLQNIHHILPSEVSCSALCECWQRILSNIVVFETDCIVFVLFRHPSRRHPSQGSPGSGAGTAHTGVCLPQHPTTGGARQVSGREGIEEDPEVVMRV